MNDPTPAVDREDLAAKIKDAYYHARDNGGTMHTAADDAADLIIASGILRDAAAVRHEHGERIAKAQEAFRFTGNASPAYVADELIEIARDLSPAPKTEG